MPEVLLANVTSNSNGPVVRVPPQAKGFDFNLYGTPDTSTVTLLIRTPGGTFNATALFTETTEKADGMFRQGPYDLRATVASVGAGTDWDMDVEFRM